MSRDNLLVERFFVFGGVIAIGLDAVDVEGVVPNPNPKSMGISSSSIDDAAGLAITCLELRRVDDDDDDDDDDDNDDDDDDDDEDGAYNLRPSSFCLAPPVRLIDLSLDDGVAPLLRRLSRAL